MELKNKIVIVVSGGIVKYAYSMQYPCAAELVLLDLDAAKNYSSDAFDKASREYSEVKETCHKVGIEINIGRLKEEAWM
jgi:hypothetical protein